MQLCDDRYVNKQNSKNQPERDIKNILFCLYVMRTDGGERSPVRADAAAHSQRSPSSPQTATNNIAVYEYTARVPSCPRRCFCSVQELQPPLLCNLLYCQSYHVCTSGHVHKCITRVHIYILYPRVHAYTRTRSLHLQRMICINN